MQNIEIHFEPFMHLSFEPMHYDALCTLVSGDCCAVAYAGCTGCFRRIDGRWYEIGKLTYWFLRLFGRNAVIARYL